MNLRRRLRNPESGVCRTEDFRGIPLISVAYKRSARSSLYMTIFQLLCTPLIGETPFAIYDVVLTNGRPSEQRSRGDCCSPRQRSRIVGRHVTWHNLEQVETRNSARFIEFTSGSGPFFGLDWQSMRCYPPPAERRMDRR